VLGPSLGLVAMVLGIAGMIFIGTSQGRLGGKGLAIGGIACSVMALVVGIAVLAGMMFYLNQVGRYARFVEVAQSDDHSELQEMLTFDAGAATTKEGIAEFRTRVTDALGAYQGSPKGFGAVVKGFQEVERIQSKVPPSYLPSFSQSMIAVPAEFEKGSATIIAFVKPQEQGAATPLGRIYNLAVVLSDGKVIWFINPDAEQTGTPGGPGPAGSGGP
jgi:uncharacterized membrane protein